MKNSIKLLFTILFGSIVTLTSCSKDEDYTMSNDQFVAEASSANMFEVAAGNLAVQKSTNTSVTAYGQHMVDDHGTAITEMMALATKKGWNIPTAMMQKHQDKINVMTALSGSAFDRQFATMMVTSHQETIALFEKASANNGVPDGDLRSMASAKLPTLRTHLQSAQQLQTQVGQ